MQRVVLCSLAAVLLAFVAESSAQRFIQPTYRPPPQRPPKIYRLRRDAGEPLWLYQGDDVQRAPATGDHPYLPPNIDDIHLDPNTRYARSVDSPSAKRGGGSHSTSSGSRDTGATHPGYNRRNARSIRFDPISPLPSPTFPKPFDPFNPRPVSPTRPFPLYARSRRDIQFPQKPKHHDIVLTGWNPNARVQPWQKIRVRA
ncbi:lebocin-4-like [Ostrinia nubilalis]|uniref:lebocin-4-like n=1 Tax=Ostrinia nubilalis TaxID=29057 RepID=UPI00308255AE